MVELLYRDHYAEYVRVASAIVGDRSQGADAVQEAFARAIAKRATFRGEAPVEAWIWKIVVNVALTARGRRRPLAGRPQTTMFVDEYPSEGAELRSCVARLPARQRHVLFLRYFADLDYRTIATVLEIEPGTVAATLSAAHASLRRSLKEVQ
jgi:RNA polymerase sigma-70 factor (ECF subfamily)